MGRGNRHGVIYRNRDDYGLFLRLLKEVQNRYPFVLQAYCLMTNHFHLELTTVNDPIWKIMQPVMNHYARMFNQKYGYDGHLFDSRYTSCLIEDYRYFLEVSRYIPPGCWGLLGQTRANNTACLWKERSPMRNTRC